MSCFGSRVLAQKRRAVQHLSVCGNPNLSCKTSATFEANDLPFRVPKNAVIYDTEPFYAIVLKTVGTSDQDCEVFVPESERTETQRLFPDHAGRGQPHVGGCESDRKVSGSKHSTDANWI